MGKLWLPGWLFQAVFLIAGGVAIWDHLAVEASVFVSAAGIIHVMRNLAVRIIETIEEEANHG